MDVRELVKEEIAKLQEVLRLLGGGGATNRSGRRGRKAKAARKMSASARRRISAAQKARWARVKAGKK
jgi:hypothetical protein